MIRYVYALVDSVSGFADVCETVTIPPARYVAECNRMNRARPRADAEDLEIYLVGQFDDEKLTLQPCDPQIIGDFSQSIEWLKRKEKDAAANVRPL